MKKYFKSIFLLKLVLTGSISCATEVTVVGNESMPFNGLIFDETSETTQYKNSGMAFEILEEATKHGAPKFNYKLGLPWKRAQHLIHKANNKPIAIIPFTRTKEREQHYTWIAMLFTYQTRISLYKASKKVTLDQLFDKPIGIIAASAHIPLLKQLGFKDIVYVKNAFTNSRLLRFNRIDAIAESQYVDIYNWKKSGYNTGDLSFIPIGETKQIYIAANLNFPTELSSKISSAIDKIRSNGSLNNILKKWEK
ncbi:transporter substrate-binding domain-containing protein [Zooshikella marina]|uniref:substrate-binding periplasmic protein n=1 Tax=Zooshikella ganghwensis TaxID=202772 RepID=UPI001BB0872D|nr:transporter substrate-binding domain-containing protein [Zooshikella ganghwensis]MBU2704764.1 transporter substrate-binding domain-containing protein [Zooshikella ganghwensis]